MSNELYHYGVKGMRWGVRRSSSTSSVINKRQRAISKATKAIDKDIESYKPYTKTGIKTKNGKLLVTSTDVNASIKALEKIKHEKISKINAKYDKRVNAINKDIKSYEPYKQTGIKSKNGKLLVTRDDISSIIDGLENERRRYE